MCGAHRRNADAVCTPTHYKIVRDGFEWVTTDNMFCDAMTKEEIISEKLINLFILTSDS